MDLVVAIGGGGQHVALAIARLMRLRALPLEIKAFVIDADGNSELSQALRKIGGARVGSKVLLEGFEARPPFDLGQTSSVFREMYLGNDAVPTQHDLFELFYDEEAGSPTMTLRDGMFGNPSVGSAVLNSDKGAALMADLEQRAAQVKRVFVVGSFLGGTGAGITHQLIRRLYQSPRLDDAKKQALYGAFLLRWFTLPNMQGDINDQTVQASQGHGIEYFYEHTRKFLAASMLVGAPPQTPPESPFLAPRVAGGGQREMSSIYPLLCAWGLLSLERQKTSHNVGHVYGIGHDTGKPLWLLEQQWNEVSPKTPDNSLHTRLAEALIVKTLLHEIVKSDDNFYGGRLLVSADARVKDTWWKSFEACAPKHAKSARDYAIEVRNHLAILRDQLDEATNWFVTPQGVFGMDLKLQPAGGPSFLRVFQDFEKDKQLSKELAYELLKKGYPGTHEKLDPAEMAWEIERSFYRAIHS